jgi:hypothetical protein
MAPIANSLALECIVGFGLGTSAYIFLSMTAFKESKTVPRLSGVGSDAHTWYRSSEVCGIVGAGCSVSIAFTLGVIDISDIDIAPLRNLGGANPSGLPRLSWFKS